MPIETGSLRLRHANWSRASPACLTHRENFKIFGDFGLYARLPLISIAAGADASGVSGHKADRLDGRGEQFKG